MDALALDQMQAASRQTYVEIAEAGGLSAVKRPAALRLRDTAHLEQFPMDRLKPPGVVRTHTLIALSTTEETHIVPASLPGSA